MKYKQSDKKNQRILSITEHDLVIGMDIAKFTHVARAVDFRGIELGKDLSFNNDSYGFSSLIQWVDSLLSEHGKQRAVIGIEPTGHYWFPLAEFLSNHQIKLVMVNPLHVNRSKEFVDNSQTKNDYKDAKVIADLIRAGHYTEPRLPKQQYAELRVLMTHREKIVDQLGQVQRRIQRWLDRYFPEFTEVFADWEGKAALVTLNEFPLPCDAVQLGANAILSRWKQDVKRAVGIKRAEKLVKKAESTVGMQEGVLAARIELRDLLEQHDLFKRQLEAVKAGVEQVLQEIPGTQEMLTVPGVGIVTLAGFLAEVGDLEGYEHGQQIIRLAGFNLKENSSGKRKGKTGISKRGRSRLRALLFRAALALVANNDEFKAMHKYLTTRSQNPLKKKQSLVALCGKLIRILHTLATKRMVYNPESTLGPIRMAQIQQVA